jgi:glycosyltransferase involved in cell wall biosynthesis
MIIYMVGRLPPPIGGVTIHTDRLMGWLSDTKEVKINHVAVSLLALFRFAMNSVCVRRKPMLVHCQTSSIWGLAITELILMCTFNEAKLVYSIHSEFWVPRYMSSSGIRIWLAKLFLRRVDLLIADNSRIANDIRCYVNRVEVITPFLPPRGQLGDISLAGYLGLGNFDSPVLVFNAYKLSYLNDGSDVYGLDILMGAYLKLTIPLALVILIPQLSDNENQRIRDMVASAQGCINQDRVHIVSKVDIEGWKVIAKADLFVRPTITDGDALSVREGLYYGVPTIASNCTIRPDGVILFRTGDINDLADKIISAVNCPKAAHKSTSGENPAAVFLSAYRSLF